MLTGDKVGTAINIGLSAGLIDKTMLQHLVDEDNVQKSLKEIKDDIARRPQGKHALILTGPTLLNIDKSDELLDQFYQAS